MDLNLKFNIIMIVQFLFLLSLLSCEKQEAGNSENKVLKQIPVNTTGIHFKNEIIEDHQYNFLSYEYYSSGGGVSVGDINNDGLSDIYLVSNRDSNRLFLNQGDFKFIDITENAGVASPKGWSSGTALVDINDDGLLDIYLSRGGNEDNPFDRQNQLFINNGDNTFSEQATKYGLNDMGRSTQAAFLDYDKDGDIDVYVLNHSNEFGISHEVARNYHQNPPPFYSDRLYRNNGSGKFEDVTKQAGILNFGFGLGIGIGDLNNDGWPDIYVANDYSQNDFCYINNQNGTFSDYSKVAFGHMSLFAMGCDIADVNNDGQLDIYTVEMLPKDYFRSKVHMKAMDVAGFYNMINNGFHYQYMHNTLQLNAGYGFFSEIAYLAGVAKTDWSWASLIVDLDHDGLKDILVTNGVLHDYKDRDFVQRANAIAAKNKDSSIRLEDIHGMVSSTPLENFAFKNLNGIQFNEVSSDWGFNYKGYSSGLAYGDFDNDGDLDLVVNNTNAYSTIYENLSFENSKNWIKLKFKGSSGNKFALGTKVYCNSDGKKQFQELYSVRGFQSSSEPVMVFGFNDKESAADLEILWPDGKSQSLENIKKGKTITIDYKNATLNALIKNDPSYQFVEISRQIGIEYFHKENPYNDFEKEILLPHKLSQSGPCIAVGDINNDGYDDFFIGGAMGQSGVIYIQTKQSRFELLPQEKLRQDNGHEDTAAIFFDADGDNDLDLYVVSGGNEKPIADVYYQDRLYLNDGIGNFTKTLKLPNMKFSGSCVATADYDNDGDQDLFVGGRLIPGKYPFPPESVILENINGLFVKVDQTNAPWLNNLGMVTTAAWLDYDNDGDQDLLVTGEWMPLRIFSNHKGKLSEATDQLGLSNTIGWWQNVKVDDFDDDGDLDFFAGNFGLNHKLSPKKQKPIHVFANDFDENNTTDIFLAKYVDNKIKPIRGKDCTSEQMPIISKKFKSFSDFAKADLNEIIGSDINEALHYEANMFATSYFENVGERFVQHELPPEAQLSPVNGFVIMDINQDKKKDVFLAGNFAETEIETTRMDGGKGLILETTGYNSWKPLMFQQTGILAGGNVKAIENVKFGKDKKTLIIIGNNNGPCIAYMLSN